MTKIKYKWPITKLEQYRWLAQIKRLALYYVSYKRYLNSRKVTTMADTNDAQADGYYGDDDMSSEELDLSFLEQDDDDSSDT
jgi:hypothetical protein